MDNENPNQDRRPWKRWSWWLVISLASGLFSLAVWLIPILLNNPNTIQNALGYLAYAKAYVGPPPACTMTVEPKVSDGSGDVYVHWDSPDSTEGQIDEIGELPYPSGYARGRISRTITFIGNFWNVAGKSSQCTATATVYPRSQKDKSNPVDYNTYPPYAIYSADKESPVWVEDEGRKKLWMLWPATPLPATCRLMANHHHLSKPGNIKLSWDSSNAYSGKLDGLGSLPGASGYVTGFVGHTTTFVATFINADGNKTHCSTSVIVGSDAKPNSHD